MSISQTDSLSKMPDKRGTVHEKKQKLASQKPLLKVLDITRNAEEEIPVIVSNSDDAVEPNVRTPQTPSEVDVVVSEVKSHLLLEFLPDDVSSAGCS